MKLLFETANRADVDNARFMLESNGIPVFVGNENSGNLLGPVFSVRQYGMWIILDEHYEDAQHLLKNPEHEVKTPVDVQKFYAELNKHKPGVLSAMLGWAMALLLLIVICIYILLF